MILSRLGSTPAHPRLAAFPSPAPPKQHQVELPPMCSASSRPGLVSPRAARLTEELGGLAESGALCDLAQLTHPGGRSVWVAYCDVYVLDADGSLSDVCLLATLAALQALRLPALEPEGAGGAAVPAPHDTPEGPAAPRALRLEPPLTPLTCGIFGGALVVDPTAEEEALMDALVCLRVNGDGQLAGECVGVGWEAMPGAACWAGRV